MLLIVSIAVLLGGLLIIGTVAAIWIDRHPKADTDEAEELPRVVVSQEVPSVFSHSGRGR